MIEGPNRISRENGKRRVVVTANVRGRDIASLAAEVQEKVGQTVRLPTGYWLTWGGQFENLAAARQRLMIVVPGCNSAEINFVLQPYGVITTRPPEPSTAFRSSGVGGLEIRAKVNLWGNDTFGGPGSTALAILPFVSLPIDRTNGIGPAYVEGGLVVPFGVQLSDKFSLGINADCALLAGPWRRQASRRVSDFGVARLPVDENLRHLL